MANEVRRLHTLGMTHVSEISTLYPELCLGFDPFLVTSGCKL